MRHPATFRPHRTHSEPAYKKAITQPRRFTHEAPKTKSSIPHHAFFPKSDDAAHFPDREALADASPPRILTRSVRKKISAVESAPQHDSRKGRRHIACPHALFDNPEHRSKRPPAGQKPHAEWGCSLKIREEPIRHSREACLPRALRGIGTDGRPTERRSRNRRPADKGENGRRE